MSPPQFGHSSGNSSPTRARSFAHAIREVLPVPFAVCPEGVRHFFLIENEPDPFWARLGEQRLFSRRQRPDRTHRPRCVKPTPRPAGMGATITPRKAAATRITRRKSPARTKPRAKAWAKLMARVGEEFPLKCPACGGDIRLIAFRLVYECETIPGLRTLGNLRLLRTSCPRVGAHPADSDTPRRAAGATTRLAGPGPTHRLGRTRADP
jgi:hypothetical protein